MKKPNPENKSKTSGFLYKVIVLVVTTLAWYSCGINIHSLTHERFTVSSDSAKNILKEKKKISVRSSDVPQVLHALHSENQIVVKAALRVISDNPDVFLNPYLSMLSNSDYLKNAYLEKFDLALFAVNEFPDSLEKVEFLSIVTRKIAHYDPKMANTLLSKIDQMEERIPEENVSDHARIFIFRKAIDLQLNTESALSNLDETLNTIRDTKTESIRYNMLNHFSDALAELYPRIGKNTWEFIEKRYQLMDSLTRRTRGLVRLSSIHLEYEPQYAFELLKSINTGNNGNQYYYILDLFPQFPVYYHTELLETALKMAKSISDPETKKRALEKLAHTSIPYDYSLARGIVSDLEDDNNKRSRLLGSLALSVYPTNKALAQYLQSLIVYSSNTVRYYTAPLAARIGITNIQLDQNIMNSNAIWFDSESILAQSAWDPETSAEDFSRFVSLIEKSEITEKEGLKIAYITGLSRNNPDLSSQLLSRSLQNILKYEGNRYYPEIIEAWNQAIRQIKNYSVKPALDLIFNNSLKMTNESSRQDILKSTLTTMAMQDIRYCIENIDLIPAEDALSLMNDWLNKDILDSDRMALSTLFQKLNKPEPKAGFNNLSENIKALVQSSLAQTVNTNFDNTSWPDIFNNNRIFKDRIASLTYFNKVYKADLIQYSLTALTNNSFENIQNELMEMIRNNKNKIDWNAWSPAFLDLLKKDSLSSHKKDLLAQLLTISGNEDAIPSMRSILRRREGSSALLISCINSLREFKDKESIDLLSGFLKEDKYFRYALKALQEMEAYNTIRSYFSSSARQYEIVDTLMVNRPELINKKIIYIGTIIPESIYYFQKYAYPIIYLNSLSNLTILENIIPVRVKYKTEFIDEGEFSSSEEQKTLKGEYHLVTLDFLDSAGNVRSQISATGYGYASPENVVAGTEDPQQKIHKQARKWVMREFMQRLSQQSYMIPLNFK